MSKSKEYLDFLSNTATVSNSDFKPIVIDQVFTEEQIEDIYNQISIADDSKTQIKPFAGHKVWQRRFGKSIEQTIRNVAKDATGIPMRLNGDYSFTRYSPEYGYECRLFPHYDTRNSQRLTVDIQLDFDEDWRVVVEEEPFLLKHNQALIFLGTQQIHWREHKKLKKSSKIDMLLSHLSYTPAVPYDINQIEILEERSKFLMDMYKFDNIAREYKDE